VAPGDIGSSWFIIIVVAIDVNNMNSKIAYVNASLDKTKNVNKDDVTDAKVTPSTLSMSSKVHTPTKLVSML
jgi:hypothetical protein